MKSLISFLFGFNKDLEEAFNNGFRSGKHEGQLEGRSQVVRASKDISKKDYEEISKLLIEKIGGFRLRQWR